MKPIFLILALLLLSYSTAGAVAPVNIDLITEAQQYGQENFRLPASEFLKPWVSYEENAVRLDDTVAKAYIYTPFLLIAGDAREKSAANQTARIGDSEKILANYAGYIVFGAALYGSNPHFLDKAKISLIQGKTIVNVYDSIIPAEAAKAPWFPKQPLFSSLCYFYFLDKDISLNKPITLEVKTANQTFRFFFDLAKIK